MLRSDRPRDLAPAGAARAGAGARASGKLADAVARKLALEPGHHLSVLEYAGLDHDRPNGNGNGNGPADAQARGADQEDLEYLLEETGVERVVLAAPSSTRRRWRAWSLAAARPA